MHVVSVGSSSNIAELSPLYLPISPYISLCLRSASVRAWTSESSRTSRTTTASRRQYQALTLALGVTLTLWGGADPNPNLARRRLRPHSSHRPTPRWSAAPCCPCSCLQPPPLRMRPPPRRLQPPRETYNGFTFRFSTENSRAQPHRCHPCVCVSHTVTDQRAPSEGARRVS